MDGIKRVNSAGYSNQSVYNKQLSNKTANKPKEDKKTKNHSAHVVNEMKIALKKEGLGNYIDLIA